jgi:GntR family transcriptional regulator
MFQINRKSKIPYYQQLYDILVEKIRKGEWKPGDMIPPESELGEQYGLSRNTVRAVMDMLVKQGLLLRERGKGSFVAQPRIEQALKRIISFTDDMKQRGIQSSSRVLSAELIPAPEDIADYLDVQPGEELALLKRLRIGNNEPMSVEESYFVHRYCPGFLERHNYEDTSLRETLVNEYGLRWSYARQMIRAVNAPRDLAEQLQVPHKAALLIIERTTYTDQDVPVEFLRIYYRGDRYSLFNDLAA